MADRARILLLIDDASIGGGQQHVLGLAEHLDRDRFEPIVACEAAGYLVDALRQRQIPVYPLALSNRPSPASIAACARLIRRTRPDIVHTHGGTAGAVGRIAAAFAPRTRCVHTYHGVHYLHEASPARRILFATVDRLLLRRTDHVICVAQSDYDLGVAYGLVDPRSATIIRNGIDCDAVHRTVAGAQRAPVGTRIVGAIGRLHRQKGHRYLVEAAGRVLSKCPDVRFQIVGDGELRGALEAQIRREHFEARVDLLGARTDVPELLATMSVFVLPSLWEGLPLALLEAMAAGVPCVATRVDGVGEVIDDRADGLLVPPADAERLADAILELLEAPAFGHELADRALAKVRSGFGVEAMVRRTEAVYDGVLRRTAAPSRPRSERAPMP